jgi:hypothetical protein
MDGLIDILEENLFFIVVIIVLLIILAWFLNRMKKRWQKEFKLPPE